MALRFWAYIFLSPGFDPTQHTATIQSENCCFKTIGVDMQNREQVIDIAIQLIAEGVQMIELCGGFGPEWIARVSAATGNVVPVGGVFYGPEARKPIMDILTS